MAKKTFDRTEYQKEYQKKYYQANKQKSSEALRQRRKERSEWFWEYKKPLKCLHCGQNHPATLQFHHRDPKNKVMEVGEMVCQAYAVESILEEVEKCDVLCSCCHDILHWEERQKNGVSRFLV